MGYGVLVVELVLRRVSDGESEVKEVEDKLPGRGAVKVAAEALDWVAGAWGAQRVKASRVAIVGAALGTLVGIFFGLPGLVLGPFLGAVAGEWIVLRDWRRAGAVGFGTWLGLLLATAAKMAIVFAMVGLFTLAWLL